MGLAGGNRRAGDISPSTLPARGIPAPRGGRPDRKWQPARREPHEPHRHTLRTHPAPRHESEDVRVRRYAPAHTNVSETTWN